MLLLLGLPVSLQQRVSWHQRQQTDVCVHVCDTEMHVQAQFIPRKRLLHNIGKVNETLSNYLPCLCQSCKFNPPELLIFHLRMWALPTAMDVQLSCWRGSCPGTSPIQVLSAWTSSPRSQMTAPDLSKLCEKAFLYYFSFWCFVKIRLMQSINPGRIKP